MTVAATPGAQPPVSPAAPPPPVAPAAPVPPPVAPGAPPAEPATPPAAPVAPAAQGAGEPPKAPASYTLKVPEAAASFYSPEELTRISAIARANDWTQEEAQAELNETANVVLAREQRMVNELTAQLQADPDYGGEKLATTQVLVQKAIDRIFPVGHRLRAGFEAMYQRGTIKNNLHVTAALAEVGRQLSEDSPRHAGGSGGSSRDPATVLYGGTPGT